MYLKRGVNLKYLIWDFDGTLAYREGKWSGTLAEVLRRETSGVKVISDEFRPHLQNGFPWHKPEYLHHLNSSPDIWWESLIPLFQNAFERTTGLPTNEVQRLARCVRNVYIDPTFWRLYNDTLPSLIKLETAGWKHIILSNHVPELRDIVKSLALSPYISQLFNSAETGFEKPNPEAFRNVLTTLKNPKTIWMIGDNPIADVEGAEKVGLPAILVRKQRPGVKRFSKSLMGVINLVSNT